MPLSLNVKSKQTGFNLLGNMFAGVDNKFAVDCLQNTEIWYQPHCFDMLILVDLDGTELQYCVRVEYDKSGQLMSGLLGSKPMKDFQQSFKYLFKSILVNIENCASEGINMGISELKAQNAKAKHGLFAGYANFLTAIGDSKAIPKHLKPKDDEPVEVVGLDFGKLEAQVAASPTVQKMMQDGTPTTMHEHTETFLTCDGSNIPVKLKAATGLGQAVKGTSEKSVYYVAALSKLVALAYRFDINAKQLSIRIEPRVGMTLNMSSTVVESIKGAELNTQADGSNLKYASMHLQVNDAKSARRVLGAVIFDTLLFRPAGVNLELKVT